MDNDYLFSEHEVRRSNGQLLLSAMHELGGQTTMQDLTLHVAATAPELPTENVRTEVRRFLHVGNTNGFITHDQESDQYHLAGDFDATDMARGAKARRGKKRSGSPSASSSKSKKRGRSRSKSSLKGGDGGSGGGKKRRSKRSKRAGSPSKKSGKRRGRK